VTGIFLSSSQDILSVIRKQGPSTEGIFVIAPEETSCKALKEKLESGEELDLKKFSVHEVAWILKVWKPLHHPLSGFL
jgi:hypothetical protein